MDSRMGNKPVVPLTLWAAAVALLLSHNLVIPVMSFEDQKNYYAPTPTTVSFTPPAHGSRGGHATPTPSHGGGHAPSHGGGGYGGTPPINCGNPPGGGPLPTTPSPPTGGGTGGGYYNPPPTSTPTIPTTPTPPTGGAGGGYYNPPPISTPTTPTTPTPPTGGTGGPSTSIPTPTPPTGGGTGGGYYNPPSTSIPAPTTPTGSPPTIPIIGPGVPITPGITVPSPPFSLTPVSPPFTCIYWSTNPGLIWGLFGWIGTVGSTFGVTSLPGSGANMNLLQALSNTRKDGFGELYRQGTAALLNSAADTRFPYTTTQVRDSFVAALSSNKAAATQARLFKLANEGKTKTRA